MKVCSQRKKFLHHLILFMTGFTVWTVQAQPALKVELHAELTEQKKVAFKIAVKNTGSVDLTDIKIALGTSKNPTCLPIQQMTKPY